MCMIPTVIDCKTYEYLSQNYKCIDRKIEITEINVQQSILTFIDLKDDLQMLVSFQILNDMR